jgi:hypothetical protein
MKTKTAYWYKIDHDAFSIMRRILRNPDVTGEEINAAICRITSYHDVLLSLQSIYWPQYKNDELVSVRLRNNDARQFVVLKSLMKEIQEEESIC